MKKINIVDYANVIDCLINYEIETVEDLRYVIDLYIDTDNIEYSSEDINTLIKLCTGNSLFYSEYTGYEDSLLGRENDQYFQVLIDINNEIVRYRININRFVDELIRVSWEIYYQETGCRQEITYNQNIFEKFDGYTSVFIDKKIINDRIKLEQILKEEEE